MVKKPPNFGSGAFFNLWSDYGKIVIAVSGTIACNTTIGSACIYFKTIVDDFHDIERISFMEYRGVLDCKSAINDEISNITHVTESSYDQNGLWGFAEFDNAAGVAVSIIIAADNLAFGGDCGL